MAYTARYGADSGGGYNNSGAVDTLIAGHYIAGGDVWGMKFTTDGGNSWWGCNWGRTNLDNVRTCYVSKLSASAGMALYGTGTYNQNAALEGGGLFGTDFSNPYKLIAIDTTHGFGGGFGLQGNDPASLVKRPCGDMIDGIAVSGTQYIFTVTAGGVWRYTDNGGGVNSITGPVQLATPADMPASNMFTTIRVLNQDNIVVVTYDRQATQQSGLAPLINCGVYLLQPTTGHLTTASGTSQVNVTTLSHPVNHIYDLMHGKDGNYYAACGYDGLYQFSLSGTTPTWTPMWTSNDNSANSIDAASTGVIWCGQGGGSAGYINSSSSLVAGHGAIKSNAAQTIFTYAPAAGTIDKHEFQVGDTVAATGRLWWLNGENICLDKGAYDCSMLRVDPFDDNKILLFGRAGHWQSRDGGATWHPAVNGFNGTESEAVRTYTTSPTRVISGNLSPKSSGGNDDYDTAISTDLFRTATKGASNSTVPAGNGHALAATGTTTFVGDDGKTYVFTAASSSAPAKLTQNGVDITANLDAFRGGVVKANYIAVSSNSTVFISHWGGTFVLDPGGGTGTKPTVAAANETGITATQATLNGTVNAGGADTTYQFQYGLTTAYGTNIPVTPSDIGAGTTNQTVGANLSGLTANTTYHWRLTASNVNGSANTVDQTFTTLSSGTAPSITESAADGIDAADATLHGTVNPHGQATTYHFEYGTTTAYGTNTASTSAGSGTSAVAVSAALTGLSATTTYHWRLVATNATGTTNGADQTFTTGAGVVAPVVVPQAETGITSSGATLNASINPGGASTTYHFEYGLTTAYGTSTATHTLAAGTTPTDVSQAISGLAAATTYHWRVVATNSANTTTSTDQTFTTSTLGVVPTVTESAADGITSSSATLHGTVNPNGQATVYHFEYGLTTGYGSAMASASAGSGTSPVAESVTLPGLSANTTYHWRLVASNATGAKNGADQTFTTASGITRTLARGLATRSGLPTSGTTPPVSIATVTVPWSALQLTNGGAIQANNAIDSAITWARANNGRIRIRVLTNGGTNIPTWALNLDGTHMTISTVSNPLGISVARWWVASGNFRAAYLDLQTKLAALYDNVNEVRLIFASMTMVQFAEPLQRYYGRSGNATAYTNAGFTVAQDKAAVLDCFNIHASVWQNTQTGFAYVPYDAQSPATWQWAIDDQLAVFGTDTQVQNNSLGNAASLQTPYTTMYAALQASGAPLAFQSAAHANLDPSMTPTSVMDLALSYGAHTFELIDSYKTYLTNAQLTTYNTEFISGIISGNPTLSVLQPSDQSSTTVSSQTVVAQASSPNQIKLVQARVNSGAWGPLTLVPAFPIQFPLVFAASSTGGEYQGQVTLVNGLNAVDVQAIDNSGSSLTTTVTVHITLNPVPVLVTAPIIEQSPGGGGAITTCQVGDVLRTDEGLWTNNPTSFANQWLRDGVAISGQTAQIYTVVSGDLNHHISCSTTPTNNGGQGLAAVSSNAPLVIGTPTAPSVTNLSASPIGTTTATLHASVNPNGDSVSDWHFEYGLTTAYGTSAPVPSGTLPLGSTAVVVNAPITGLTPGTTYHFRCSATNTTGTTPSADRTFTTPSAPLPLVTIAAAAQITQTTALLSGQINPQGSAVTDWHFEYGTTTGYGTSVPSPGGTLPSGSVGKTVSIGITGLTPSTTYHYRLVATNTGGTTPSADGTFQSAASPITPPPPPPPATSTALAPAFRIVIMSQDTT